MSDTLFIHKALAKRAFERAAVDYDSAAVLQREVNQRLLERLDYINFTPEAILDVGAGTGFATYHLYQRFTAANITALDLAYSMLTVCRSRASFWQRMKRRLRYVNAEAEALPFADNSFDMVYSNLTLQWVNDLAGALQEFRRVLKPGGMLLFSTFGPDTLKELRDSWQQVDGYSHVNHFLDMHDIGDAMLQTKLAEPVTDMENFTLTYPDIYQLMRELKTIGAHNVTSARQKGLTGKSTFKKLEQAYESFRQDSVLPASYEVIYGHAWSPLNKLDSDTAVHVSLDSIKSP